MHSETSLLDLPDEIIQEVLSYLSGLPKRRVSPYTFPSPNVCDWEDAPDVRSLAALARSCRRLRKLAQPLAFRMAGVYKPDYWSEASFYRALRDNLTFCQHLHFVSIAVQRRGPSEPMFILCQCANLRSLELSLPNCDYEDRTTIEALLTNLRFLGRMHELVTIRLCFKNSPPLRDSWVLQFLRCFSVSVSPRCLQIVGLAIADDNVNVSDLSQERQPTQIQELVLLDCKLPITVLPKLLENIGGWTSLASLRLDNTKPLGALQQGLHPNDPDEIVLFRRRAPWQDALPSLPVNLRNELVSLEIIHPRQEEGASPDIPPDLPNDGDGPLFPRLSHLGLGLIQMVPLLSRTPQYLTVSTKDGLEAGTRSLQRLSSVLAQGHLPSVKEIRFIICSDRKRDEGPDLHPGPEMWRDLDLAYDLYVEMTRMLSIKVDTTIQRWYNEERALGLLMQRMELENESAEDIEEGDIVTGAERPQVLQEQQIAEREAE